MSMSLYRPGWDHRLFPLLSPVLDQLELHGVHQGLPAGFDDILGYPDGAPGVFSVPGFDQDPDRGGGAGGSVQG
jgi:hypothetical protein